MFVKSDKSALYCVKWSALDKSSIQVLNVMMTAGVIGQNLLSHKQLSIDHSVPISVDGGGLLDSLLLVDVSSRHTDCWSANVIASNKMRDFLVAKPNEIY